MTRPSASALLVVLAITPRVVAAADPATAEPMTWIEIPDSAMSSVTPAVDEFPGTWGAIGPAGVIAAWNGAALDTARSRLILHGGGHNDYWGNEIYAFDIPSMTWTRLTDPTVMPPGGSDIHPDGTPQSRHTYNGQTYIAHLDRFFVFAGSGSTIDGTFPPTENVWTFDFGDAAWRHVSTPPPMGPPHGEGSSALYDPTTGLVWYGEGWNSNPGDGWGLWSWDPDAESWTHHDAGQVFSSMTGCIDDARGRALFVGGGHVFAANIRDAQVTISELTTTGATDIIDGHAIGLDYDPVTDRVVAWNGGPVHVLDPDSLAWTTVDAAGAPTPDANGTYHRFSYVASVNAFISVNAIDANVFFYKHGPGEGTPPPGPDDTGGAGTGASSGETSGVPTGGSGSEGAPQGEASSNTSPADASSGAGAQDDAGAGCGCVTDGSGRALGWLALALSLVFTSARRRRHG